MNKEKLRYAILKEVSNGNSALTESDFEVTAEQFDDSVNYLTREGYLKGVQPSDDRPHLYAIGPVLTDKGEAHLEENSTWGKLYKGIKEIRDWLK
ncbi:YjcQ family protein [Brevibacillus sp. FIR094]|uniref:YjcQ family protein n=1 Tax=Brevibacillus sp. FIR094 TaxID=3134809 RepID=UPI003D1A469E